MAATAALIRSPATTLHTLHTPGDGEHEHPSSHPAPLACACGPAAQSRSQHEASLLHDCAADLSPRACAPSPAAAPATSPAPAQRAQRSMARHTAHAPSTGLSLGDRIRPTFSMAWSRRCSAPFAPLRPPPSLITRGAAAGPRSPHQAVASRRDRSSPTAAQLATRTALSRARPGHGPLNP